MKNVRRVFLLAIVAVSMTSCASMFNGIDCEEDRVSDTSECNFFDVSCE